MNSIGIGLLLVLGPALAIITGCWGVEILEENILGVLPLTVGVGYPPSAILCYRDWRRRTSPLR